MVCRSQFIFGPDGRPIDVDMGAVSSTVLAMGYDRSCLLDVFALMRSDLEEMLDG